MYNMKYRKAKKLPLLLCLLAGLISLSLIVNQCIKNYSLRKESTSHLPDKPLFGKQGSYTGKPWIKTNQTISKIIAAETKFARCDIHTVRTENGNIIDDWLFMEEKDAINAIVVNENEEFVMFRQSKYGINGETLSPVGGFIDDGESPFQAAKREVLEELGLGSTYSKDHDEDFEIDNDKDWVFLGQYRTMINRGGGFISLFLLKNAIPLVENGGNVNYKGMGDDESQKILFLNRTEILRAVSKAELKEVKWAAALALSLLYLDDIVTSSPSVV